MQRPPTQLRTKPKHLQARPYADVLILGGGINGIATFRDLALQGVDVALVELKDFASGTSSASSHMIHGGLRYLENGEFRLVKESVVERNRLLRLAPHYVRPLETTIPIFRTFSGLVSSPIRMVLRNRGKSAHERGALLIKIGLTIYDTFSSVGKQMPRHKFRGKRKTLLEYPRINSEVKYSASYFDASVQKPERLALDVLQDGVDAGGGRARAVNYVGAVGRGATLDSVRLQDADSGALFDFTSKVVLNATGPWVDLTNSTFGHESEFIGATKGSHIVLDHPELLQSINSKEIFFENSDGRIVLIHPINGMLLVGTTDEMHRAEYNPVCTDNDIQYFIDIVGHIFPNVDVNRSHVVFTFSGLRPLPKQDETSPGVVSRDYRLEETTLGRLPFLSLIGGKWTTFRALAEALTDDILLRLSVTRATSTKDLPIGGGKRYPRTEGERASWREATQSDCPINVIERMFERYGTRASEVLAAMPPQPRELTGAPGYYREELAHLARTEAVVHLDDLILRRTSIAFEGLRGPEILDQVTQAVAAELEWDEERCAFEITRAAEILRLQHRISIGQKESPLV